MPAWKAYCNQDRVVQYYNDAYSFRECVRLTYNNVWNSSSRWTFLDSAMVNSNIIIT